ncbi:MAG TPA: ribonuclease E inhibitor RraB [Verrucomicrobiae bacterium]|nr:ribonuclease E inhibitor RraB [Verrucomicrobiae bacterium]
MSAPPQFPNDANGAVLRRMFDGGDDLSKPRMLDFCFIFPERHQALAFAELVNEREFEVRISYYEAREMLGD